VDAKSPTDIPLRGPYVRHRDHLLDEFARLDLLIKAQVIRWHGSTACAGPEQDWGMVVISREEVTQYLESEFAPPGTLSDRALAIVKPWWDEAVRLRFEIDRVCDLDEARELRLLRLAESFALNPAEKDILLTCLIADVDDRYRRLFGYLQNDASRQHPSVEVIIQILRGAGLNPDIARNLFLPTGSLLSNHLIVLSSAGSGDESLYSRSVGIDDRIASYLLGSDEPDARLAGILEPADLDASETFHLRTETSAFLECLPPSLRARMGREPDGVRMLLLGKDPKLAARINNAVCRAIQIPSLNFDVPAAIRAPYPWELLLNIAFREARLAQAAIFFQGCGTLLGADDDDHKWQQLDLVSGKFDGLIIAEADSVVGMSSSINDAHFWQVEIPPPDYDTRKVIWEANLPKGEIMGLTETQRIELAGDLAGVFQITESQIEDAVAGASNLARRNCPSLEQIEPAHMFEACRRQSGRKLVTFAQRIEPRHNLSIDDLVLPAPNKRQLVDLRNRIHHHRELFQRTGFEQTMRLGKGLLALFAGGSGTGKTLAAEALASGQGVDLYKVDLSAVTSKWVGETEKNLSRIFAEAESSSGCGWLFFDEGESLFGSRGDVKQAQDRLLNMEVNYLLQRIEEFSGVVILATNLRQNIDEAFLRRIHALVEFPQPNAESRIAIWKKLLPENANRDFDDRELAGLASRFAVSGGNIRNIVLDAMFRACGTERMVLSLRHVLAGIAREYQKLGRPITGAEFGNEFYSWVVADILDPEPINREV
jgi:hypothetical protein